MIAKTDKNGVELELGDVVATETGLRFQIISFWSDETGTTITAKAIDEPRHACRLIASTLTREQS